MYQSLYRNKHILTPFISSYEEKLKKTYVKEKYDNTNKLRGIN